MIITQSGREAIAEEISTSGLMLAWGPGDGSWTTPPTEDESARSLISELGRRLPNEISFVTPSPTGDIIIPGAKYARSSTPTRWLFVSTTFDYADESTATIRQTAIFKGTVLVGGLPSGQRYFTPANISSPGKMLELANLIPIPRSNLNRETFNYVIEF